VEGRRYSLKLWCDRVFCRRCAGAGTGLVDKQGGHSVRRAGSGRIPMRHNCQDTRFGRKSVEVGQTNVLRALKMENAVNSEKAGVVAEIKVSAGDSVGSGTWWPSCNSAPGRPGNSAR